MKISSERDAVRLGTKSRLRPGDERRVQRNMAGQVIVEGTLALMMILLTVIGAVYVVIDVSAYIFYKQKVALVADQTAQAASSFYREELCWNESTYNKGHKTVDDLVSQANTYGTNFMQTVGLPGNGDHPITVSYNVPANPQSNFNTVTVTVTASNLPLMGNAIFGNLASIKDTAVAIIPTDQPPAVLYLAPGNDPEKCVMIPAYGFSRTGDGTLYGPGWDQHYDSYAYLMDGQMMWNVGYGPPTHWDHEQLIP